MGATHCAGSAATYRSGGPAQPVVSAATLATGCVRATNKKKPAIGGFFITAILLNSAAANDGRSTRARRRPLARRSRDQAFTDGILPRCLSGTTNGFAGLAHALLRRLFVIAAELHFTEHALALKTLLQHAERLIDIVVANENLQEIS
jgi:hypothetical protein